MGTEIVGFGDLVVGSLSVGLLVTSFDDRVVWANRAARAMVGGAGTSGALAGLPLDPSRIGKDAHEVMWTAPDGTRRWLEIECRHVTGTGSGPGATDGLIRYQIIDVTHRREREEHAVRRADRLSRVEALASVGTWEWDLATDEVTWSDTLLSMFGYPPGYDLSYEAFRSLVHPDDLAHVERVLGDALGSPGPFTYTNRMLLPHDGQERVFECYAEVLTDGAGRPVRVMGTAHDITEQTRIREELAYLADHDPLTGLPNRRSFTAHLLDQLRRGPDQAGALLLLDVDNFKDINDLRGHAVGDHVMRALSQLLRDRCGPGAVIGRLGGDEFAVALPAGDAGDALALAEALCDAVAQQPIVADGAGLHITVSIGVAPVPGVRDLDVLLANADLALYEAKRAGRNRARLFAPEQYREAAQRVSVLQRVQHALDTGSMGLDAQPMIDLAGRRVVGHELFVRLRDGIDPPLAPADFLPPVERTDLVLRLDRWVIERAIAALATGAARRSGLHLAVNVSSRSLEDPQFGDDVVKALRDADVEPVRLGLEITETAAITSLDAARHLADRLTSAGCRFTLDDFGAGFGSFVYLKHLPFTSVKIAGEFVRQVDRTAADRVLVEAVVRVARGLGMGTIAEYVDREPLVDVLQELGVQQGQGFHLGRPRPLADLLEPRHDEARPA